MQTRSVESAAVSGRVVPRLRRPTHATFPRVTRPKPLDHGRTVPTSLPGALVVVQKKENSTNQSHFWNADVGSNEAERKRGTNDVAKTFRYFDCVTKLELDSVLPPLRLAGTTMWARDVSSPSVV